MAVRRITKRWLFNSFGVILVILIAAVIGLSFGIRNYYYSSVKNILMSRLNVISDLLLNYYEDNPSGFDTNAKYLVEEFEYRDRMEFMAINTSGKIAVTSSGFVPDAGFVLTDYVDAMNSGESYGEFLGTVNQEKVFAVTKILPVSDVELHAVRLVASLTLIDRQIIMIIAVSTMVGIAIILFVIITSSYFINSIVVPVGQVGETARRIAQGDFNVRLEKKNDDEIGELCDVINHMAEELSATDRMKNDFISSVSHELRTPLTAIKGWSETVLDSEDRATREKGMGIIISETERLSMMVEELLDFSRIQSGGMQLMMERIDILAELGEAVIMYSERAKREGIRVQYEEPELSIPVWGDKNRLRQVFVNVLDNALKYSDPGGLVRIAAIPEQQWVRIEIEDHGIGIREEDLPKVKSRFYKGESARRGSGIGLAVADEIVSMHMGTLSILSEFGRGTTVVIMLPIQTRKSDKPDPAREVNE